MLDPKNPDITPPTIVVMMPCYGGKIFLETVESLLELQREGIENGIDILWHFDDKCSLISLGRSVMTTNVYRHLKDWTHLLWVDADVGFAMEDLWKLIIADKDIVGGMYPMKSLPIRWTSTPYPTDNKQQSEMDKKLVRTHYIANGFMLCKREAIQKMMEHYEDELNFRYWNSTYVDLFQPIIDKDKTNLYLSEDYAFCKRANDIGIETWIRNDVKLSHTGTMRYSEADQNAVLTRIHEGLVASSMAKHL